MGLKYLPKFIIFENEHSKSLGTYESCINYLKNFKLNNAKKNDSVISFNNDVFIFDEIDDLLNPLTNQLNIVDCNINKIVVIIVVYCVIF